MPTLAEHGPDDLYTSTLFHFTPGFLTTLTPGLELGRFFVTGY